MIIILLNLNDFLLWKIKEGILTVGNKAVLLPMTCMNEKMFEMFIKISSFMLHN